MPQQQRCSATPAAELCYGSGNVALRGGEKEADFALNNVKEGAVMPCGVCGGYTLCFTTYFSGVKCDGRRVTLPQVLKLTFF
jgi:hypothetical protein